MQHDCLNCQKRLMLSTFSPREHQVPEELQGVDGLEKLEIWSCRFGCGVSFLFTKDGEYVGPYFLMNQELFLRHLREDPEVSPRELWEKEDYVQYIPKEKFLQDFFAARNKWRRQGCPRYKTRKVSLPHPEQNTLFEDD